MCLISDGVRLLVLLHNCMGFPHFLRLVENSRTQGYNYHDKGRDDREGKEITATVLGHTKQRKSYLEGMCLCNWRPKITLVITGLK